MKDATRKDSAWLEVNVTTINPQGVQLVAEFEAAKAKLEAYFTEAGRKSEKIKATEKFNFGYKKLAKERIVSMIPAPLPMSKEPTAKAKATKGWC
jgi:hypothetical protein